VGQDPGEIRQDIERTREQMGDTVEALSYKADVKARAKDSITDRVDSVKSRGQDVKQGARRAKGIAEENPLGLAIGAVAVGFIAGLAAPTTRVEDERIGPMADQLKETGQEALERGKQVAQQTAQSAKETAQQAGQEHAEQLKESAAQGAREAAPSS
jgi:gas vesicle protein